MLNQRWGSATQVARRWEEHQAQHQGLIARLSRTRINSAIYLGQMRSEEAEPLTSSRLALHTIRKIKSADHLPHGYDASFEGSSPRGLLRPVLAISHHVDDNPPPTVEQHLWLLCPLLQSINLIFLPNHVFHLNNSLLV